MTSDNGNGEGLGRDKAPEPTTRAGTPGNKLRPMLSFAAVLFKRGRQQLATGLRHAAVAACLLGCAAGVTLGMAFAEGDAAAVKIDNFTFTPKTVTVKAGTTVTWTNQDDEAHTVTSTTKQFKSKPLDTGNNFSFTFTTPGSYQYFCSLHPFMTGTIVVEAATGSGAPSGTANNSSAEP
jgi:plastocyanin